MRKRETPEISVENRLAHLFGTGTAAEVMNHPAYPEMSLVFGGLDRIRPDVLTPMGKKVEFVVVEGVLLPTAEAEEVVTSGSRLLREIQHNPNGIPVSLVDIGYRDDTEKYWDAHSKKAIPLAQIIARTTMHALPQLSAGYMFDRTSGQ